MPWPLIIGGAVVLILIIWFVAAYNGLTRLQVSAEEGFSTMDVYLKKRYDLIPNLVETVKGYAKHEAETLEKVIQARNMATSAQTIDEKIAADNQLTGTLKTLFAVAEAYPELKANTNFLDLQNQLKSVEQDIANSRKYYNGTVARYNTKCRVIPSNIVAGVGGFKQMKLYEADAESRENVKVQF